MPRSSKKKPSVDWSRVLVDRLDPDESIRDLIDERISEYDQRRSSTEAAPRHDPER